MERPAWLREEADQRCGFWRRNYEVAVEVEDACTDALLAMLERELAKEETSCRPTESANPNRLV
jgi:hypothetical protein